MMSTYYEQYQSNRQEGDNEFINFLKSLYEKINSIEQKEKKFGKPDDQILL